MRMIINKLPPALAALALLCVLMSAAATVRAAGNDIQLSGTLTREDFRSLTRQLGFAASYFPLAPAAPLGILGLDAGVEATAVKIAKNPSFWQRAFRNARCQKLEFFAILTAVASTPASNPRIPNGAAGARGK